MTVDWIRGEFVEFIPESLEPGVLYVSIPYVTTAHLCACGCGREVNLALDPNAHQFTYDGCDVTLSPSVGNWSFPCQSHYWIQSGAVRWSGKWSADRIAAGRQRTFEERTARATPDAPVSADHRNERHWWSSFRSAMSRLLRR